MSGCGSVVKLIDPTEKYTAYAGVAYDLEMAQQWGLPILDLPLSFFIRHRITAPMRGPNNSYETQSSTTTSR